MIVALTSARGAPGVSTFAFLLAELWPGDEPSWLLEADPAGGILAARWLHLVRLGWEPGLLDLASSRAEVDETQLERFSQSLTGRTRLIPAPPNPDQVRAALANFGPEGSARLARSTATVIADCGRHSSGSPALPLARAAAITCVIFRPTLEESQAVLSVSDELRTEQTSVFLISVGDGPYLPADVAREAGGLPCLSISDDQRSAAALRKSGPNSRGFRRTPLARSAQSAAVTLHAHCPTLESGDVVDVTDAVFRAAE